MKKQIVFLLVLALLALAVLGGRVLSQTLQTTQTQIQLQPTVKELQTKALLSYMPTLFPVIMKSYSGVSNSAANQSTGEIWVVSIPRNYSEYAVSGFLSSALMNVGTTDWPNVTITATFQVLFVKGGLTSLMVCGYTGPANTGTYYGFNTVYINQTGTYVVTSLPFTMKPNLSYTGHARVGVQTNIPNYLNQAIGAYVKITSIKFNFQ